MGSFPIRALCDRDAELSVPVHLPVLRLPARAAVPHELAAGFGDFSQKRLMWSKNVKAHIDLGVLLAVKGDAVGAKTEYRASFVLDPKDVSAHINLGVLLANKADSVEAEAKYRTALALDPKHCYSRAGITW
jgi:hypothetical protein